MIDDDIS
ncbi:unnamed protein product, partial [Allacma fusca]